MRRARKAMDGANLHGSPLWLTEWSSDSPAMIADIVSACLPNCHAMSQWALSSTFEEIFVPDFVLKEGDSGWGMMARGIALPAFNTYKLQTVVQRRERVALPAWRAMDSPQYPTPGQLTLLRERADIAPATILKLSSERRVTFDLPPEGIALLEVG